MSGEQIELTTEQLAVRETREKARLEQLGVAALDGATIMLCATVLRHIDEDGNEKYAVLDPNIVIDERLKLSLPKQEAPRLRDTRSEKMRSYTPRIGNHI